MDLPQTAPLDGRVGEVARQPRPLNILSQRGWRLHKNSPAGDLPAQSGPAGQVSLRRRVGGAG